MADVPPASRAITLTRVLCVVVLLGMVLAVGYAGWIALLNFSRIAV